MATPIPFNKSFRPVYGAVSEISPLIRRVVANNPGPFTFTGSGTYIIGRDHVAIVDPGPASKDHVSALMDAVAGEEVSHILVTHTHRDHSGAVSDLKKRTGATTYGFGPHGSGRVKPVEGLGEIALEEGADHDFEPDIRLAHGEAISAPGWTLEAVHTPGHCSNHLCYALREESALFTGDHVMGWSTTVVAPPDGDMRAYMDSLEALLARSDSTYYPTHGAPIPEPKPFVEALIAHRHDRERQIRKALEPGAKRIADIVPAIYADIPEFLYPAAGLSVLAHLIDMAERGIVRSDGPPRHDSLFALDPS
ncbi:MAG TPA: MBL fold metallo-hydrolase [Alphaproteobacteria bacterium]|nr:MBL fold metallo-hydrolase [Alphaproteobacteria bacterium]